jgi:hypothetical protein
LNKLEETKIHNREIRSEARSKELKMPSKETVNHPLSKEANTFCRSASKKKIKTLDRKEFLAICLKLQEIQ